MSKFFWRISFITLISFDLSDQIWQGNAGGESCFLGSAMPVGPIPKGFQHPPIFWDPLPMPIQFDLEKPNLVLTWEKFLFLTG